MDMAHFKDQVFDFDCRLGSILNHAFDDCSSCEAVFKVCARDMCACTVQVCMYVYMYTYIQYVSKKS